ncbi:MAG: FAD:protein FMN transferase [Spirochaetota bacterium]
MKNITLYILIIIEIIAFISCSRPNRYTLSQMAMGTIVTITVDSTSPKKAYQAINQAFETMQHIEEIMSPYKPTSDVAHINNNLKTVVSNDTFTVIKQSLELSHKTNGLFDITFAACGKLWQLNSPSFAPPSPLKIKEQLTCVNYRLIHIDMQTLEVIKQKPCITIDLGGIAKGYAIAQAASALKQLGIQQGIVEAGGDLEVLGDNYGYGYTIGIKHPRHDGIIGTVVLHDGQAIATSGDYERYTMYKGKRYHHILNPKTGYPANTNIISVSVISNNATICDGYATAFFIMGSEHAIAFCKNNAALNLQCIIIDKSMNVYFSESLLQKVSFPHYSIHPF